MASIPKIRSIISTSIETVPLEFVYDQLTGVKVYQAGEGIPEQTDVEGNNNVFISNSLDQKFNYPFISQGIGRYEYESQNEFISYGKWLAEPRKSDYFDYPKLVINEMVNPRIRATFIEEPAVVDHSSSVVVEKSIDFPLLFLLGLLNSKLFTYYIGEQSSKSANNYPTLNLKLLKSLPIVICDPIDKDKIADLSFELAALKKHLNAFIRSFSTLIASKFSISTPSPKLHNWHGLKFSELVQELLKAKVKLSPLEETEWKKYFNEKKEKAIEIKTQIDETDEEIDQMIYELYELSEKEIRMVEDAVS